MLATDLTMVLGAADGLSSQFRDLVIILSAAALVVMALQRLRMATVPAYLITGAVIGPGALGFVSDPESVAAVSNLAIILLLFGIGLHMDIGVLARSLGPVLIGTVLMTALSIAGLWPLGLLMGLSAPQSLVVAMALSMSSTVVVLKLLQQRKELGHPEGRLAFGTLIVQDILAIVLLLLLPPIARWSGTGTPGVMQESSGTAWSIVGALLANGAIAIAGVTFIILTGRYVLPRLLTEAARGKSAEVLVVLSIASALGSAWLTQHLINNPAIGAFLAGFLLSSTPFRHHISGQVGAVRDLFGAVFFTAVGMSVSLDILWAHPLLIAGVLAGMLVVKASLGALSLWAVGATGNVALKAGLSIAQAGEFSVLMLAAAAAPGVAILGDEEVGLVVSVVVLSLIVTPLLLQGGAALNRRLPPLRAPRWIRSGALTSATAHDPHASGTREPDLADSAPLGTMSDPLAETTLIESRDERARPDAPASPPRHAIIAGYGLVGRAVADELKQRGVTSTIIELNPTTVRTQSALGRSIVFGDASNPEVLETAGIDYADLLILTIPDEESVLRACRLAHQIKPGIKIVARTNFVSQGVLAASMGATGVVVEEMATAKEMERVVLQLLGTVGRDELRAQ